MAFVDNTAQGGDGTSGGSGGIATGGAVLACGGTSAVHLTFSGNQAIGGSSDSGVGGAGRGAALSVECAGMDLRHSTLAGNSAVAGSGAGGDGIAEGGGLHLEAPITAGSNLIEGNTATVGAVTTDADCDQSDPYVTSLGFNTLGGPTTCDFVGTGDQTAAGTSLLPLGDHGCDVPLVDGSCLPTMPIAMLGAAIDQGSCFAGSIAADVRGESRPWDDAGVVDADDSCDPGSYESRDDDGDDAEDAVDNCDAVANADQTNSDADSLGDACDNCDLVDNEDQANSDADSLGDACDNCSMVDNEDQADGDSDGIGDVCDLCYGDNGTGDADGDGQCADVDCDDGDPTDAVCTIFVDGFESGDTNAWSRVFP